MCNGALGGSGQSLQLRIVGRKRGALIHHALEFVGLALQQLGQFVWIIRRLGIAERAKHAVKRVQRHAVGGSDCFNLPALKARQRGNGKEQAAALAGDEALLACGLLRGDAKIEEPSQTLIGPGALLRLGGEIDFLRHHAHDGAELLALHRRQMA